MDTHPDQQDYAFLDALVAHIDEKVCRQVHEVCCLLTIHQASNPANGSAIAPAAVDWSKSFVMGSDTDHGVFKDIIQLISSDRANATEVRSARDFVEEI